VATFEHDGWTLAYEDVGSGLAVLLVHGLLMDRTMFSQQVDALADRYRVIAPDLRGHGESEHRAQEYTQWDLRRTMSPCSTISMWNARSGAVSVRAALVEFVTVPRAGHSSPVENPRVVTEAIDRFLDRGNNKVVSS
jgi:pimeloyl-ACP methyl ester carboxylesterase